jgi:soluble lytic murein transglycosylase-like protein
MPIPAVRTSQPARPGARPASTPSADRWAVSARTMPRGVNQAAFAQALAQARQGAQPDQAMQSLFQSLPGLAGLPGQAAAQPAPAEGVLNLPNGLGPIVTQAANKYGVDPALVAAVMETESGFNAGAVSRAGARGLMQLMPGTARGLGVTDAHDPLQSAMGGAKLLGQMLDKYNGKVDLALAAYNAGSGAVDKYGDVPPYAETRSYVTKVTAAYERFHQSAPTTQATGRTTGR